MTAAERHLRWREANPERWRAITRKASRKYYAAHRERAIASVRRYQATEAGQATKARYFDSEKGITARFKDAIAQNAKQRGNR